MAKFKELLPKRIPEYLQGDNALKAYLEAAGELFDAYHKTITDFDYYDDYERCPETRLRDLASQFAFRFPSNLTEEIRRNIMRDIVNIFQHNGTEKAFRWIFRLIGWEVEFLYTWVLNPEFYYGRLKTEYQLDNYDQEQTPPFNDEVFNLDYRTFLFGREIVHSNGTYFSGKRFFDEDITFEKLEIIGEAYRVNKTRTPDKVIKTPYIFVQIREEDYNLFIQPYEDEEGNLFDYTNSEAFKLIENLINFFLYESFRPAQVRVVMLVVNQLLDDKLDVDDTFQDIFKSEPIIIDDEEGVSEEVVHQIQFTPTIGVNGFVIGMPMHPDSKDVVWSVDIDNYVSEYNPLSLNMDAIADRYFDTALAIDVVSYIKLLPAIGIDQFVFSSPDQGNNSDPDYQKHRVYNLTHRSIDLHNLYFEPELESMAMELNCIDDTYDVLETELKSKHYQSDIHLRNPSKIESPCFSNFDELPVDVYVVGFGLNEGDKVLSLDFVNKRIRADLTNNPIRYAFDPVVMVKRNRLLENYTELEDKLFEYAQLITDAHTMKYDFGLAPNFDINMKITYLSQD